MKRHKALIASILLWTCLIGGLVWAAQAALGSAPPAQAPPELIQQLESEDTKVVTEAVRKLREQGYHNTIRQRLKSPDPKVRYHVAYAIAELRAAEFVEDMVALFSDENPKARNEAAWFLAELAIPGYQDQVAKLLKDPDSAVRQEAVLYLGAVKAAKYKKELEGLLNDPEEPVRKAASEALRKMPGKSIFDELPRAPALERLESDDPRVVSRAVAELRDEGRRDVIRQRLKSPDPKVRYRVAYAIALLRAAEFVDDMVALFSDENPKVPAEAVFFLAGSLIPGYQDKVAELLNDPEVDVREGAAYYLGAVKASKHEEALKGLLNDREGSVRKAARRALDAIHGSIDAIHGSMPTFEPNWHCEESGYEYKIAVIRGLLVDPSNYQPDAMSFATDDDERTFRVAAYGEWPVLIEEGTRHKVWLFYSGQGKKTIGEGRKWSSQYFGRRIEVTACTEELREGRLIRVIHSLRSFEVLP